MTDLHIGYRSDPALCGATSGKRTRDSSKATCQNCLRVMADAIPGKYTDADVEVLLGMNKGGRYTEAARRKGLIEEEKKGVRSNPISRLIGSTLRTGDGSSVMIVQGYAPHHPYSVVLVRGEEAISWDYDTLDEAKKIAERVFAQAQGTPTRRNPSKKPSKKVSSFYKEFRDAIVAEWKDYVAIRLDLTPGEPWLWAYDKRDLDKGSIAQVALWSSKPLQWNISRLKRAVASYEKSPSYEEDGDEDEGDEDTRRNPGRTEHSARQHAPSGYKSCGRKSIVSKGRPLALLTCSPSGRRSAHDTEVASVKFPVEFWTPAAAKKWLRDHGFDDSRFEAAVPYRRNPAKKPVCRGQVVHVVDLDTLEITLVPLEGEAELRESSSAAGGSVQLPDNWNTEDFHSALKTLMKMAKKQGILLAMSPDGYPSVEEG